MLEPGNKMDQFLRKLGNKQANYWYLYSAEINSTAHEPMRVCSII